MAIYGSPTVGRLVVLPPNVQVVIRRHWVLLKIVKNYQNLSLLCLEESPRKI